MNDFSSESILSWKRCGQCSRSIASRGSVVGPVPVREQILTNIHYSRKHSTVRTALRRVASLLRWGLDLMRAPLSHAATTCNKNLPP